MKSPELIYRTALWLIGIFLTDTPPWYQSAEWWLVIAAIPTLIFVGWQARETARSAETANRNIEAVMDEKRARVEILAGNVALDADKPIAIGVRLKNAGPTMAFIQGGKAGLLKADKEIEPNYPAGAAIPFIGPLAASTETTTQMVIFLQPSPTLTIPHVVEIQGTQSFIHFYGFIYGRIFGYEYISAGSYKPGC
jgi:hypothetical protein